MVALDTARKFGARISRLVVSGAPLPALVAREEIIELDRFRALAAAGGLTASPNELASRLAERWAH